MSTGFQMGRREDAPWPRVVVVTPSFNQVRFLEKTFRSVLEQGCPNLEYILIDGGSTDGSVEIIKRYAEHLSYWCSESDEGHYFAVQKGLSLSSGDIMNYINSDDILATNSLFTVAELLSDHSGGLAVRLA